MTATLALVLLFAAKTHTPTPAPAATGPAVTSGERKLTNGQASLKLGTKALKLSKVSGSIQTSSGMQIASLIFTDGKKGRLQIDFMYQQDGPVDPSLLTNLYAEDGSSLSAWKKGIGSCTVTLAKATPNSVEGTASCPKGMLDKTDKPARPITEHFTNTCRSPSPGRAGAA